MLPAAIQPQSTGIMAWFDATQLATPGPVASWPGRAGGTATAPSANNRPTFSSNGLNGRPTVVFDGVNDCLEFPAITGTYWTTFLVIRRDQSPTYGTAIQVTSPTAEWAVVSLNNDASTGPIQVTSGATTKSGGTYGAAIPRIISVSFSASGFSVKESGIAATISTTQAGYSYLQGISLIGAARITPNFLGRFFAGAISEIRVYGSIAASQEAAIYQELANKWGVA